MPMLDDPELIDRVYEKHWLPARRRYAERLKDANSDEFI